MKFEGTGEASDPSKIVAEMFENGETISCVIIWLVVILVLDKFHYLNLTRNMYNV